MLIQKDMPPKIVCAAMLMEDGLVVPGVRHLSPDMRAVLSRIYGDKYHLKIKTQGFINTKGEFLNRKDAWKVADQNGQICVFDPVSDKRIPEPANQCTEGKLFSENLY